MPQSLAKVIVHIVFATKDRVAFLTPALRGELHPYMATLVRSHDCECHRVGGTADHVHLAVGLGREMTVAGLINELKTASSKWIKTKSPDLAQFAWQRGYGVFSVSPQHLNDLLGYIDRQEEHHRSLTFQEEYRRFLQQYQLTFDERYLWD